MRRNQWPEEMWLKNIQHIILVNMSIIRFLWSPVSAHFINFMNNIISSQYILWQYFQDKFQFISERKKLFWKEKRTNKESSHQSNVKFLALQIQRRKIDDALFKYSPNVTNLPNPNLKDKIFLCNTYDTVKLGTRFSSSFLQEEEERVPNLMRELVTGVD